MLEYLDLHQCLVVEAFLVAHHFQRDVAARLVVQRAHHLTEGALAQGIHDLVAVEDVVSQDDEVVAPLVIVGVVVRRCRGAADLRGPCAKVPDLREVQDLALLVVRELLDVVLEDLGGGHGQLRLRRHLLLLLLAVAARLGQVALLRGARALGGGPRGEVAPRGRRGLPGAPGGADLPGRLCARGTRCAGLTAAGVHCLWLLWARAGLWQLAHV
mmetsp:Transcript_111190/g.358973  ORF Transcript_111190/g.358973 Transcript_111190/m.358973 type:complete len:214 (+) Transcript_111190:2062-2703(+)